MGSPDAMWDDDDPARVNAELVPPRLRPLEDLAAGTQKRSVVLQGAYLLALAAVPSATFVLRTQGADAETVDAVSAVLLLVAVSLRVWRQHRSPDGRWVRARRDVETARSQAWHRAVTGTAAPGDSVRGQALAVAGADVRWACYRRFRVADQIAWFTRRGGEHAAAAARMRWLQNLLAVAALVAVAVQAAQLRTIPVAGLVVALLAAAEAWAQFRRSAFVAASYRETAEALRDLHDRAPADDAALAEVAGAVEHLLERELWTWVAISSAAVLTERSATARRR